MQKHMGKRVLMTTEISFLFGHRDGDAQLI
jgi:hypothetical protein